MESRIEGHAAIVSTALCQLLTSVPRSRLQWQADRAMHAAAAQQMSTATFHKAAAAVQKVDTKSVKQIARERAQLQG